MNTDQNTWAFKFLRASFRPMPLIQKLWAKSRLGPFGLRVYFDATPRPYYAYCMFQAALMAKQLGYQKLSAIEFGVAGGNGLLAMEEIAGDIEKEVDVEFEIFGFDTGEGMPAPVDYRDLPCLWRERFFAMDVARLKARLQRSALILGNVSDTVKEFYDKYHPAPVGFVSFDLDYYSSTVAALGIFDAEPRTRLPRCFCYFDDLIGEDHDILCEHVGELLAINEFNARNDKMKLSPIYGLGNKRWLRSHWTESVFVLHDFLHKDYNTYILKDQVRQLALK